MSRYTTQHNHEITVISALNRIIDSLYTGHVNLETYCARRESHIYATNSWKRLTQKRQAYVSGIEHALLWGRRGFYNTELEFCQVTTDGERWNKERKNRESKVNPNFYQWLTRHTDDDLTGTYHKVTGKKF